jgi:hypothetical protein
MINAFNSILLYLICIFFVGCKSNTAHPDDFKSFSAGFEQLSIPANINDFAAFRKVLDEKKIETLFSDHYGMNETQDIPKDSVQCYYYGKYESKNYTVLLYKQIIFHSNVEIPKLIMNTYSHDGKKLDSLIALWNESKDSHSDVRTILRIQDDHSLDIKVIESELDDWHHVKNSEVKILKYLIEKNGKIIKIQEIKKDV